MRHLRICTCRADIVTRIKGPSRRVSPCRFSPGERARLGQGAEGELVQTVSTAFAGGMSGALLLGNSRGDDVQQRQY